MKKSLIAALCLSGLAFNAQATEMSGAVGALAEAGSRPVWPWGLIGTRRGWKALQEDLLGTGTWGIPIGNREMKQVVATPNLSPQSSSTNLAPGN